MWRETRNIGRMLMRLDQWLNVWMRSERRLQILTEDLRMRKNSQSWCFKSWQMNRNNFGFMFHLVFWINQRCLASNYRRGNVLFSMWAENKTPGDAEDNKELASTHQKRTYLTRISRSWTNVYLEILKRLRESVQRKRPWKYSSAWCI